MNGLDGDGVAIIIIIWNGDGDAKISYSVLCAIQKTFLICYYTQRESKVFNIFAYFLLFYYCLAVILIRCHGFSSSKFCKVFYILLFEDIGPECVFVFII